MEYIARFGWMNRAVLIWCPSHLAVTQALMAAAMSASVPLPRSRSRTSVSSRLNRQLRIFPSAVMRKRSQFMQNGWLTLAMKPTRPMPSSKTNSVAGRVRVLIGDRDQRHDLRREPLDDFVSEQDFVALPGVVSVERHELDEPQFNARLTSKLPERDDLVLGHAAH